MFDQVKKGYNMQQVDTYLLRREAETRKVQDEQIDRIRELRSALSAAEEKLSVLQKKERLIADTLIAAVEKAQDIEALTKKKYDLELAGLKAFHAKWQSYYTSILEAYPLDETLEKAGTFNAQMTQVLSGVAHEARTAEAVDIIDRLAAKTKEKVVATDAQKQFESESKRLETDCPDAVKQALSALAAPDAAVVKNFQAMLGIDPRTGVSAELLHQPSESGFSFEEALHPTQELGDIMKALGIEGSK